MAALTSTDRATLAHASGRYRRLTLAIGVVAAAVCVLSVLLIVRAVPAEEAVARGTIAFLVIAVPIATGLYAVRVPYNATFGLALIAAGFAWSLTALSESTASLPYSIGRLAGWLVYPSLIFLMLAFPTGRVAPGIDRSLFRGLLAVLGILYIGSALLVEQYPEHVPWATCRSDCPPNAFLILDREPAVMDTVVQPLREALALGLFIGVILSMTRHWRAASKLRRRTLTPLLITSALLVGLLGAFFVARRVAPDGETVRVLALLWGLCIAGLAAAFWVGLMRRRLHVGEVLADLAVRLSNDLEAASLRDALRAALRDPTLEVLVPDGPVRWVDADGRERRLPTGDGRAVTLIEDEQGTAAVALVYDDVLRGDEELLTAIGSVVLGTVRHHELTTKLATTLTQLEGSRRRIAEAADLERARIERDLHDGAQQRLMMLRIRLSLAEEQLRTDPTTGAAALHDLGTEAERTLDELRSLAHGVYPAILSDRGLEAALRSLASDSTIPLHLHTVGLTRLPMEIETAVYFTCLEAVQNATKHAPDASAIWVRVHQSGQAVALEVRDDGPGFTPLTHPSDGAGLRNMHDRLEAVGGSLTIDTAPGRGTRIVGRVPLG